VTGSAEFDQLKRFAPPEQGANENVRISNDPFHSAAAVFSARLVHGIDGDLYRFLVGDGAHDLASVVPSALHDTLPPGFAEAKTHDVVRRLVEGLALGLSALLDGLKNVVVQDDPVLRSHGCAPIDYRS
jgi:hypothetical protein